MKERIKTLRKQLGLNQTEFGSRIGATQAMITSYETGRVVPDESMRLLICSEFGIRREWLELGHEPMKESEMKNSPESLVPELVAILSDNPALLDLARRAADLMTVSDWKRLNALLSQLLYTKKDPQA